jgi:hypothetical protein
VIYAGEWECLRKRKFRGPRASRVLVLASRQNGLSLEHNLLVTIASFREVRGRKDALASTRDARAPRNFRSRP